MKWETFTHLNFAVGVGPCCSLTLKPLIHTTLPKGPPVGFCILHSRKPYLTLVTFLIACQCTQQLRSLPQPSIPELVSGFIKLSSHGDGCFPLDSRIEYLRHNHGFEEERDLAVLSNQTAFISWQKRGKKKLRQESFWLTVWGNREGWRGMATGVWGSWSCCVFRQRGECWCSAYWLFT